MFKRFRKKRPQSNEPYFGLLILENGLWTGDFNFDQSNIQVLIQNSGGMPLPNAANHARTLEKRYKELTPAIGNELKSLLAPWEKELESLFPLPEENLELLALFKLQGVEISQNGIEMLTFYLDKGWDDALFNIGLTNWVPTALGIDD